MLEGGGSHESLEMFVNFDTEINCVHHVQGSQSITIISKHGSTGSTRTLDHAKTATKFQLELDRLTHMQKSSSLEAAVLKRCHCFYWLSLSKK